MGLGALEGEGVQRFDLLLQPVPGALSMSGEQALENEALEQALEYEEFWTYIALLCALSSCAPLEKNCWRIENYR